MGVRLLRVVFVTVLAVLAFAGLTYAAQQTAATPAPQVAATTATIAPQILVVPDVHGQAFVFAKGMIQDAGFAWHVTGSVGGYAVDTVATQRPDGGDARRRHGRADPDADAHPQRALQGARPAGERLALRRHRASGSHPSPRASRRSRRRRPAPPQAAPTVVKPAAKPAVKPVAKPNVKATAQGGCRARRPSWSRARRRSRSTRCR